MEFGHSVLSEFQLDPNYTNLNHGSFGAVPRAVAEYQQQLQVRMDKCPDRWFRIDSVDLYKTECDFAAEWLGVEDDDWDSVVLCKNTSAGITAIVRSLLLHCRQKKKRTRLFDFLFYPFTLLNRFFNRPRKYRIICFDFAYVQVKQLLSYLTDFDSELEVIKVPSPDWPELENEDKLVAIFKRFIDKYHQPPYAPIILAIIDVVSSVPAMVLPYRRLTAICHDQLVSIPVLLDAAHAVGQIEFKPLNVEQMNERPDFFITNFHKWAFTGRGCAALYVSHSWHSAIVPAVVSAGYHDGNGTLRERFQWTGTDDVGSVLTVSAAWLFRRKLCESESEIFAYTHDLSRKGGRLIAKRLGTDTIMEFNQSCAMTNVLLPNTNSKRVNYAELGKEMLNSHNIYLVTFQFHGRWWLRVSAQVYNQLEDFEYAADCLFNYLIK